MRFETHPQRNFLKTHLSKKEKYDIIDVTICYDTFRKTKIAPLQRGVRCNTQKTLKNVLANSPAQSSIVHYGIGMSCNRSVF